MQNFFRFQEEVCFLSPDFLPPDYSSPQIKKSSMFPSLTGAPQVKHCMCIHLYFQKEKYHYISFKILLEVVEGSILRSVAVQDTKTVCHALKMYSFRFCKCLHADTILSQERKPCCFLSLKYHQHTKVPQQS